MIATYTTMKYDVNDFVPEKKEIMQAIFEIRVRQETST